MKKAEILSVGEELLCGAVVDTNAAYLSRMLRGKGYRVLHRQTCGDEKGDIIGAVNLALSRSDFVVITGGLGPTHDDLTRPAVAEAFGVPLLPDERVAASLREYFSRRGVTMSENNLLQALVPEGARVLWNSWGTAPGLWLEREGKSVILLPGVPREMKAIFEAHVLPFLATGDGYHWEGSVLRFYGIAESRLDEMFSSLDQPEKGRMVAPYAGGGEVELHLSVRGKTKEEAQNLLSRLEETILSQAGEFCYGQGDENLETCVVNRLIQEGLTIATAESCTGGLLSQRITSVSGASSVFSLGMCTYSEEEKKRMLGVQEETLSRFGVYSKECALEMAEGVAAASGSDLGVGITGIAGPGGGTERDPVGTVYLAVVWGEKKIAIRTELGGGRADREYVRRLASSKALALVLSLFS